MPRSRAQTLSLQPRVQRKRVVGNALWKRVRDGLQQGLSPEQVSGTLSRMDEPVHVSPVKLDQTIYIMPRGALRTEVISLLHFGHSKQRLRARGRDRRMNLTGKLPWPLFDKEGAKPFWNAGVPPAPSPKCGRDARVPTRGCRDMNRMDTLIERLPYCESDPRGDQ